jgi:hypothetical protein
MNGGRILMSVAIAIVASRAEAVAGRSHVTRPDRACIPSKIMAEWQPLDDSSILVWSRDGTHAYLLVVEEPIAGLAAAENIFIYDADLDGLICAGGHDRIATEESARDGASIASIELIGGEWTARRETGSAPIPET